MNEGYRRDVAINEPGIVGARWWNRSLIEHHKSLGRRKVLKTIAVVGGAALFLGLAVKGIASAGSDTSDEPTDVSLALKKSLEMQKQYGWDFGARGQALVYDGEKQTAFDRTKLGDLSATMTPLGPLFRVFHRQTLLESLPATPTTTLPPPDDPSQTEPAFVPLKDVLVPSVSESMKSAYKAGEAIARLAAGRATVDGKRLALLVDLPGPETIAFAAGAAEVFEPVLLFDNWPHPKGVVAAHGALAALAYYQPRFESARAKSRAWPAFLLDRGRTATYSEASDKFDNRYYARFPSAEALAKAEITQLLYVIATPSSIPEPDDLNWSLSQLSADARPPAIGARAIALTDFRSSTAPAPPPAPPSAPPKPGAPPAPPQPPPPAALPYHYGGLPETDASIWTNYPVFAEIPASPQRAQATAATKHTFLRRAAADPSEPASYALVGVMVAAGTGLIVAAALDRAGSMNRFSGGWSG